jgi:hypothetical protein
MKTTKKTRNASQGQRKSKSANWKNKAILRRKENEKLRKRITELEASRKGWKKKWEELHRSSCGLQPQAGEKARGHQYSLAVVALMLELYKYGGMSLRGCRHSVSCMLLSLGLLGRTPSHASIRNWICKCGNYRVKSTLEVGGAYVVIVDESITFGSEKILLVLGVSEDRARQGGALKHEDVEVLFVGSSQEWKAEQIALELQKVMANKDIKYVTSDLGTNLRKTYKSLNITHISDCTHVLANHLKRIYEKSEVFEDFRKLVGKLRREWNLSKTKNQYMPPNMRAKMRFANIFPCVDWAQRMLANWEDLGQEVQEKVQFLKDNATFFQTLSQAEVIFKTVCAKLKNEGFGIVQKQELLAQLDLLNPQGEAAIFQKNCKEYLDELALKRETLGLERLICSSDIIESYFGKFKIKINKNTRSGLTEFIFTLATFGKSFSIQETKLALESIKCKQLTLEKQPKAA